MIEPYASLQTVFIGCLAVVLVITVVTPFIRLKPKLRNNHWWLTGTHLLAWVVALGTLIVSVNSSKPGDTGVLGAALTCWAVAGMIFLLLAATVTPEEHPYRRRYEQQEPPSRWAYYLWSMGGFIALMVSMCMVSGTSASKSSPPSSVEYSTAADGSKTPVGSEKYPLEKSESGQWVTTALGDRAFSKEQRTVYTWTEKRKSDASDTLTVTKHVTTTIDENDISVVNDVKPGETPWVEYTPVYYLAPAGLFDDARPNPEQDKLCVLGRDTGCKANAKPSHNKIVLHLPEVEK